MGESIIRSKIICVSERSRERDKQNKIIYINSPDYFRCLLMLMVTLMILGTLEEILIGTKFLRFISLPTNHRALLALDSEGERVTFVDTLKLSIIMFGIAGHTFGCLETIPGWYTVNNLYVIKSYLQSIFVQPMLNEGGLGIGVTWVGGEYNGCHVINF